MQSKVKEALARVLTKAHDLSVLGCLSDGQSKRLEDAKKVLTTIQTNERRKKYKMFLRNILEDPGSAAVLVCVLGLGLSRITAMSSLERKQLCQCIRTKKTAISDPILHVLAIENHIPTSAENTHGERQPHKGHRVSDKAERTNAAIADTAQDDFMPELHVSQSALDFTRTQVLEHASIQGITAVFDNYLCGAIRKVTVSDNLKAAVTTVLPVWGGPVACLISLDICDEEVERLAMALFNAKVKRIENVLHIVLDMGMTLILPNSEPTLKGVTDTAIIDVFGSEICNAINDSPIRKREREEGKQLTECVSMILTKNGAIISLSLGLEGGLRIQNKLYV